MRLLSVLLGLLLVAGCGDREVLTSNERDPIPMFRSLGRLHNEALDLGRERAERFLEGRGMTPDGMAAAMAAEEMYDHSFGTSVEYALTTGGFSPDEVYTMDYRTQVFDPVYAAPEPLTPYYGVHYAYGLPPAYASITEEIVALAQRSDYYWALETYMNQVQYSSMPEDQKNFALIVASVAQGSAEYWDQNAPPPGGGTSPGGPLEPGTNEPVIMHAAAPLVAFDAVGAAMGAGMSIVNQWGNINWWKVGGSALVAGAGSSMLRWMAVR